MKSFVVFIAGGLMFAGIALGVGTAFWPDEAIPQGGAAFALAFVPAALTLAWVLFGFRATPDMRLFASLGGSGIRMAIALGGGLLLTRASPEEFGKPFWVWLVLFYLTLLAFEIVLLVRQQPNLDGPPQA